MRTVGVLLRAMGATEIVFIFVIYLLLFGAKGIPSLAKTMGQAVRTFRNATEDIQRENNAGGRPHRSVIKIHPQVKWPILEDSDLDPKEFYREVEHVCRTCADGQGMASKEKLTVLLQSPRGHRR